MPATTVLQEATVNSESFAAISTSTTPGQATPDLRTRLFRWIGDVAILAVIVAVASGISRTRVHDRFLEHHQDLLTYGPGVDKPTAQQLLDTLVELKLFQGTQAHAYVNLVAADQRNRPQGPIYDEQAIAPAFEYEHFELRFAIASEALYPPESAPPNVKRAAEVLRSQAVEQCRVIQTEAFGNQPLVVLMVDRNLRVISVLCELGGP